MKKQMWCYAKSCIELIHDIGHNGRTICFNSFTICNMEVFCLVHVVVRLLVCIFAFVPLRKNILRISKTTEMLKMNKYYNEYHHHRFLQTPCAFGVMGNI